jgi:hypothetical protein
MRAAAMSAGLFAGPTERECADPQERVRSEAKSARWNPEYFGREQLRGLVRQVFFSIAQRSVRQIIFSAADPETDVRNLCWQVGEALALETQASIAVVGEYPQASQAQATHTGTTEQQLVDDEGISLRQSATRAGNNLWLVPPPGNGKENTISAWLHSYLCGMRAGFEYSIVAGPPAGESNTATAMAQLADGIVLVLSANHTRRITARKIKERLEGAQACLLGTVLSDRVFPIPEGIYRRL